MPNKKSTLTVREYARQEGISLQTVYRRLWQGEIQAQQFLGRWLISPEKTEPGSRRSEEAAIATT